MRTVLLAAALLILPVCTAFASPSRDHVSFGQDINVSEEDAASDVVCAFCSVHLHGDVRGDVAVFFGDVSLDADHSISGDVALFGGDLNLGGDSRVGGNVAIAAGNLNASPNAVIRGSRAIFPGHFWIFVLFSPLLILIGIIWLIVHLVRRNRYRLPVYPNGRRI